MQNNTKNNARAILLQGTLFAIFILFFFWVIYKPAKTYKSNEIYRPVLSISPQKAREFGGKPTTINVGLYIHGFPEFKIKKNHFVIDLTVWFEFDPRLITLKRISNFTFEKSTILTKRQTNTKIEKSLFFVQYFMRITLKTKLEFEDFPIDDHRINLSLINKDLSPSEGIFQCSKKNITLSKNINIPGWDIINTVVETGYIENKLKPSNTKYYPVTTFFFDFARTGIRHILSILLPLLIIFFLSLLTFTFKSKSFRAIIFISVGSISAILAHYFVIDRASPPSSDIMISDYLFLWALIGSSTILTINIIGEKLTQTHKNIITIALYVMLIVIMLYFFLQCC